MGEIADMDEASISATLRDAGASLALEAEDYKLALGRAITKAARTLPEFTAEDVREILADMGAADLDHPNAMGAAFLQAARAGIIDNTGRVTRAARTTSHRRAMAIWRSLIFRSAQ